MTCVDIDGSGSISTHIDPGSRDATADSTRDREIEQIAGSGGCCPRLAGAKISPGEAEAAASLFKALSDPTRVRIVNLLANSPGPVCLCEINEHFDLGQPTMSHHLKKLASAGLLTRQQRGTWAYFSVNRKALQQLADVTTLGRER